MDETAQLTAFKLTTTSPRRVKLTVHAGVDTGAHFFIDALSGPVIVGTGPAAGFRLTDTTVSRRHVTVSLEEGRVRVKDLGSKNGTRVANVQVVDGFIEQGTELSVGTTLLRVTFEDDRPVLLPVDDRFGGFLGMSAEVRRLYPLFRKIADSRVPTLIEGETGTGKEVLAEALHSEGPLSKKPFVTLDCTTLPPSLAESELFGHEKGAFTGATARKLGAFELAEGGTLFIDEIGDLDLSLQSRFLRVLDRGEFRRVGGEKTIHCEVRVLAATRRDLDAEVVAGRFRDDLYHRLVGARVELPPLRTRKGDVPFLAAEFARALGPDQPALPPALVQAWTTAPWPGNCRELRRHVERYVALGQAEFEPTAATAPTGPGAGATGDYLTELLAEGLPLPEARRRLTEEFERRYIEHALAKSSGNVSEAARNAGVARRHFQVLKAKLR